jgi:hypothetical protein
MDRDAKGSHDIELGNCAPFLEEGARYTSGPFDSQRKYA